MIYMAEGNQNQNSSRRNNYKIYIAVFIALILLAVGFYLYYFYPQLIPGMASTNLQDNVNVLIMGFDDAASSSESDGEINVDTMVLVKLDTVENNLSVVNIISDDKSVSEDIKEEELSNIMAEAGALTDTDIDYYFTVSYNGFKNLVDNLEGITIELDEDLKIPDLALDLHEGNNNLSGEETLNYVRWYDYRTEETTRVKRQQQVINAIIDKAFQEKGLVDIPELFNTTVDTFKAVNTNIEYTLITELVQYLMKNKDELTIDYTVEPAE
ncbi:MAG: hypothetical protein FH762_10180 [Firmicutes bacterium]|nr:hypothetical protein [Bacillota bacterium]